MVGDGFAIFFLSVLSLNDGQFLCKFPSLFFLPISG